MRGLFSEFKQGFAALRRHPRAAVLVLTVIVFTSAGSLYWRRAGAVLITVDGKTRKVYAKGGTISDLLFQERITLGPDDFTMPISTTYLRRNMAIHITRVTIHVETVRTHTDPHVTWSEHTRQNLRRILVQRGRWLEETKRIRITEHDHAEVHREVVSHQMKRQTFFTLTLFNKSGFPLKTYNLIKAPVLHMLATGYYVGDPMVPGDETRLGYKLQRGLVAVDPTVVPLGTRLYIPDYGYSFASDTGSAIKGLRVDLAVKDAKEEKIYNHRKVTLYLLDRTHKW